MANTVNSSAGTASKISLTDADLLGTGIDASRLVGININGNLDRQGAKTRGTLNGGSLADFIRAGSGDDSLYGMNGNDVLVGGAGKNYLDGGNDDDVLAGGAGDDTYMFSAGNDTLIDTAGASDRLYLRGSVKLSDLSFVTEGSDLIITDSRLNSSIRIVDHFGDGRIENLRLADGSTITMAAAMAGAEAGVTAAGAASAKATGTVVQGTAKADTLVGTDKANELWGGAGNDTLRGMGGNDRLMGEAGNDTLDGGAGDDLLSGGQGDDRYILSAGSDRVVDSGGSADVLQSSASFADLSFTVSGKDLTVTNTKTGDATTIVDHFGKGTVEQLQLADGTKLDMTDGFQHATGFVADGSNGWGGLDLNEYRGAAVQTGAGGVGGNPNNAHVVNVALGTTVAQLEAMIAKADAGTTFLLQKGTYVFDDRLDIRRSDVTLKGAGEGETIIKTTVMGTDTIRVQAAWQKEAYGNIESSEAKLNTTLKAAAGEHATTVTLASVANVKAGDFLEISIKYDQYRDDASDGFKGTLVEVASVNAKTGTVTLKHEVGFDAGAGAMVRAVELLHNVVLGDFTIDYGTPANEVDKYRYENNNKQYLGGETGMGVLGNRAIFLNGLTDSSLYNVTIHNAGSNGVVVREAVEIKIDGLTVDGVQNLGDGGNGYGLELARTYFSDFDNLTFDGLVRHAVTYSKDGSSAYNNVHVLSSTANVDFHGGPDYKNIYYVESMDLSQLKDDYAFNGIDYRDENNEAENTVVFDKFVGADAVKITNFDAGYKAINYTGKDAASLINNYSGARDDIIYMGTKGGSVNTAAGNDTIHSGTGADLIRTGVGNDRIVFHDKSGHDTVLDFKAGQDKIVVEDHINGTSIDSVADLMQHLHADGHGNVVLDLGGGHDVLLIGVQMSQLSAADFVLI